MWVKKEYNENTGMFEYYDSLTEARIEGSGISDAIQKAAASAFEAGAKKVGEKAGEYTASKIFSPKPKPMGDIIMKELKKETPKDREEYLDKIFSGSGSSRIKKLINRKKNIH